LEGTREGHFESEERAMLPEQISLLNVLLASLLLQRTLFSTQSLSVGSLHCSLLLFEPAFPELLETDFATDVALGRVGDFSLNKLGSSPKGPGLHLLL
jgi:hypothetical protein